MSCSFAVLVFELIKIHNEDHSNAILCFLINIICLFKNSFFIGWWRLYGLFSVVLQFWIILPIHEDNYVEVFISVFDLPAVVICFLWFFEWIMFLRYSCIIPSDIYLLFFYFYRYLRYVGYEVVYVRNFTDVDDNVRCPWLCFFYLTERLWFI